MKEYDCICDGECHRCPTWHEFGDCLFSEFNCWDGRVFLCEFVAQEGYHFQEGDEVVFRRRRKYSIYDVGTYFKLCGVDSDILTNPILYKRWVMFDRISIRGFPVFKILDDEDIDWYLTTEAEEQAFELLGY